MINVAVLGYGTVGSGVVEVIETNNAEIAGRIGDDICVKYILDLRDFPGDPHEDKVVHDFNIIVNDPDISVVCETMGGKGAAYNFTKQCLEAGKSVCSSNKELVAAYGPELIQIAREKKCNYLFEASVGGGIPIIRPLNNALTAEHIESIMGILNGTTNYILTHMDEDGADFADVLKKAQELGYAEKDPTADVEGHDAGRKIAILSSLMCGKNVKYEDIHVEGISNITDRDFAYAHKLGMTIKLLASSKETTEGYFAMVAPFLVAREHPLYMVRDVFNAVFVHGNMVDDTMYYGRGAGSLPTASAVVADVVEAAKHIGINIRCNWDAEDVTVTDIDKFKCEYMVRVPADDKAKAEAALPVKQVVDAGYADEFAFVTEVMEEGEFNKAAESLSSIISKIRLA